MVKCFAKRRAGDNRNLRLCANYLFICLLCLWTTIVLVLATVGGLMSKYLKLFQRCQQLLYYSQQSKCPKLFQRRQLNVFFVSRKCLRCVDTKNRTPWERSYLKM